jgi:hypothetical protein
MTEGAPPTMPLEVRLHDLATLHDNSILVRVRFDDGVQLAVEFPQHSDESAELLEMLTQLTTRTLARLGSAGVVIAGFTPGSEDDE